ncbi:MAG: AIPR family protein [Opitutae bacterium]|nr:AIPR family protein [Opitutae bacterium]
MALDITYPAIASTFGGHVVKGGTESRAFLAWFLENYWRLDETEVFDAVCDGSGDKGVDGVYVNHPLQQIDIFQVTVIKGAEKTLGDSKLKAFAGTLGQFSSKSNAEHSLLSANAELKAVAERTDLVKYLDQGYTLRGVFVTNGEADISATGYLKTQPKIILYDGLRLQSEYITIDKTDPIAKEANFDISSVPVLSFPIGPTLPMVVAPIAASELVKMDGISNGELFAWNVRQFLGKGTEVNKSVSESIKNVDEHKYFPAFHNGITVLCKKLDHTKERITISGYAVVNGCQSINNLYVNRGSISPDLRILTKFIQVEPDSPLAAKITDHTNNQNGTTQRDLQSNSAVQTRLQSEIHSKYPEYRYRIKRGEHPEWSKPAVIENEMLARIALAFDLDRAEAWSQNYRLFDDLHSEIFGRPNMDAARAVFMYEAYLSVQDKLALLKDQSFATYTLSRWLVMYLVREALNTDKVGRKLVADAKAFYATAAERTKTKDCVAYVAQRLVRIVDGEVERRKAATGFWDYKKDLKNKEVISRLRADIISRYQIVIDDDPANSFENRWNPKPVLPP